ncbi:PP2C family protein-serine/threonine phosphatase [Hugenholtzia roseola]|uniref:PP2C family protein-serine/threonine phosphatase n=1 Tax=Hugenholtzia roseola TaxID=1002 RepID=UPI00042387C2|nr:SpoIIE family protein phosphatase [Hugenholtzia roseola]
MKLLQTSVFSRTIWLFLGLLGVLFIGLTTAALQAQNLYKGQVVDEQNAPLKGVKVDFKKGGLVATSDGAGNFTFNIAATNQPTSSDFSAQKEGYTFFNALLTDKRIRITMRNADKKLKGQLFSDKNVPFASATVVLKGANDGSPITTDAMGNFSIALPAGFVFDANREFIINGKKANKRYFKYNSSKEFVELYSQPIEVLEANRNQNKTDDKKIAFAEENNISSDLDVIMNELEAEKQALAERGAKIKVEMERIAQELNTKPNLRPTLKDSLMLRLEKLSSALIQNETAFEQVQAETRSLLSTIGALLNEKDSLKSTFDKQYHDLEEEKKRAEAESRQRIYILLGVTGAVVLIAVIIAVFLQLNRKQKNQLRRINEELTQTQSELEAQKQELESQNKKITDSMRYAQTIQHTILPNRGELLRNFEEVMEIFLPKDIVSGDFYWYAEVEKADFTKSHVLAVVDCTGHGVPGAFMSMIGNTLLNEIVNQKKILNPAEILENLHLGVKKSLRQGGEKTNDDGMDICLCVIERGYDAREVRVLFTGAKRPLYYLKKDEPSLQILRGDNKSIGGRDKDKPFTVQELSLQSGDLLYLSTDGLCDQNGLDENQKAGKFGSQRFTKILTENYAQNMTMQEILLMSAFNEFKGDKEQRDDITLLGVRL